LAAGVLASGASLGEEGLSGEAGVEGVPVDAPEAEGDAGGEVEASAGEGVGAGEPVAMEAVGEPLPVAPLAVGASEAEVCTALPASATFTPDVAQTDLLAPRYARFRALYPALQAHF
jgi:hypothetical protein